MKLDHLYQERLGTNIVPKKTQSTNWWYFRASGKKWLHAFAWSPVLERLCMHPRLWPIILELFDGANKYHLSFFRYLLFTFVPSLSWQIFAFHQTRVVGVPQASPSWGLRVARCGGKMWCERDTYAVFGIISLCRSSICCQDKLGTNATKTQARPAFSAGHGCGRRVRSSCCTFGCPRCPAPLLARERRLGQPHCDLRCPSRPVRKRCFVPFLFD